MSLYNMIHGYNPACLVFLPMLGRQYHEYPRFRDCFVSEDEKNILINCCVSEGIIATMVLKKIFCTKTSISFAPTMLILTKHTASMNSPCLNRWKGRF